MSETTRSRQRLSDAVAQTLQDEILSLTAGDRLPTEAELAERFEVSRTVVREATRLLVQRGLVTVSPGRGMTVATVDGSVIAEQYGLLLRLSEGTFEQLMELRLVLEVEMAALAAARHNDGHLAELTRLNERLRSADPSSPEFLDADLAFHEQIAQASGNPFFPLVMRPVNDYLSDSYSAGAGYPSEAGHTVQEHLEIAEAIAVGDPARARFAAENHLRRIVRNRASLTSRKRK
ncbi:FadR/GntR family transcriptional regulator [Rhodococcus opacus]|uniref:Putative GntR family transcriptional regulator n=1 Tax=Rhodococcus opacus (strain B4) TaxID=632772 RepID=C1ARS7_RHOOB|nr:FadR/GntR family transcriptional regulator [Rhodococcus opacus]BAH48754.1 putative GntR family transcriptional regulator [Rhodococcus opacus B4]